MERPVGSCGVSELREKRIHARRLWCFGRSSQDRTQNYKRYRKCFWHGKPQKLNCYAQLIETVKESLKCSKAQFLLHSAQRKDSQNRAYIVQATLTTDPELRCNSPRRVGMKQFCGCDCRDLNRRCKPEVQQYDHACGLVLRNASIAD